MNRYKTLTRAVLMTVLTTSLMGLTACAVERETEVRPSPPIQINEPDTTTEQSTTTEQPTTTSSLPKNTMEVRVGASLFDGDLPGFIAHLYGTKLNDITLDLVTIRLTDLTGKPRRVHVTVHIQGYSTPLTSIVEIEPGRTTTVGMTPVLDTQKLYALSGATRSNIEVVIEEDDAVLHTDNTEVSVQPINRVTWFAQDGADSPQIDLRPFVASMVTPDEKSGELMKLLDEARQYTPDNRLSGYQDNDPVHTYTQVFAIYRALQDRQMAYSSVTGSFFDGAQYVRLPAQTLRGNGANCIDGTLLFASALEALGIQTALVFMTGHVMLGFKTLPDAKYSLLETTAIDHKDAPEAMELGLERYKSQYDKNDPLLAIIDIAKARQLGILPMSI